MTVTVQPGKASGTITAPPSKSFAHRMILCAALADGVSYVHGVSMSEDILATLDCVAALGVHYTFKGDTLEIHGGIHPSKHPLFPCRESGSTLRFFIPVSLLCSDTVTFHGTERLMERGIGVYETLFSARGISCKKSETEIQIEGNLTAGTYTLPGNVSSQYVSGLLFALPLLGKDCTVQVIPPVESRPYIDITIAAMRTFGVEVTEPTPNTFFIRGAQNYQNQDVSVEGDWSNAAFLFALKELGGDVTVTGLNHNSIQGDKACLRLFQNLNEINAVSDISDCPDLAPVLFALAAVRGDRQFTGTKRLKIKECDRGEAMALELAKFGVSCELSDNAIRICGGAFQPPKETLCGHNDHRIVMALTILASLVGGTITDAQAVRKSYPNFFDDMCSLGLEVQYDD